MPLDLGSEGVINMQIAAFDADDLADGSGKAKISWVAKELLATKKAMGIGGSWESSSLRSYLSSTIKPMIPEAVANRIVGVNKVSDKVSGTVNTVDDLWIPDKGEVQSNGIYTALFQGDASRIKFAVNAETAEIWPLRSYTGSAYIYVVTANGSIGSTYNATTARAICLGFCTN